MATTYRGIVKDNRIELQGAVVLPEGAEVEVVVRAAERGTVPVFDREPLCKGEDVDALMAAIDEGKRPVRYAGPFDTGETAAPQLRLRQRRN